MIRALILVIIMTISNKLGAQKQHALFDPIEKSVINFQLTEGSTIQNDSCVIVTLQKFGEVTIRKRFPDSKAPRERYNQRGERLANISNIYQAKYTSNVDIEVICSALKTCHKVKIAEPNYLPTLCFIPSDDSVSQQYALNRIQALAGWDLHQGDTNTVIGITDTGIDLFHPDLYPNIAFNYSDPVDGIDNDNDGFADNFYGWDTGDNDNDPSTSGSPHGSHISGISSAATNNEIGIAGSGFKCRFLPIRIQNADGLLAGAYDGLVYAANHGCKIINCSWGGYQYSEINAEIVRYASINMDCIVFCGAGNDSNERLFYPASYPYSVSIGASDAQDGKADFSNFGDRLDLFAPGDLILSTWTNGEYVRSGGTSMSSPLTAGCAGILRSAYPQLSAQQILYQLKSTSDRIDNLPINEEWFEKLGSGRVNLFRALSETGHPAVVLIETEISDNNEQLFLVGDTIFLSGKFINYLSPATNVALELSSLSEFLQVINPNKSIAGLNTLDTFSILSSPFKIVVLEGASFQELARLRLSIQADNQLNFQTFPLKINADFINIKHNLVNMSIGSDGRIGITGDQYIRGLGIRKPYGDNLMYEAGIMAGIAPNLVVDAVRGTSGPDMNWETTIQFDQIAPFGTNLLQYKGAMRSTLQNAELEVSERVLADSMPENKGFVIVEYTFKNMSNEVYQNFYAGIFTDWDLANYDENRAGYDALRRLSYVHTVSEDTIYGGIQLLDNYNTFAFAFENTVSGSGGINGLDGLSSEEKYSMLSNSNPIAGEGINGADIVNCTSSGPFTLEPQQSIRVAFAIHLADSESAMLQQASDAINFFNQTGLVLSNKTNLKGEYKIYPNPARNFITINSQNNSNYSLTISDITGNYLFSQNCVEKDCMVNLDHLTNGTYLVTIVDRNGKYSNKLIINR